MHTRFDYDRDGDEESAPIYHSAHDTYAHCQCFADPGMVYLQALTRRPGSPRSSTHRIAAPC